MADDIEEEGGGSKREQEMADAVAFSELVEKAGGSTAAARILGRSRGAVEKWAGGKSRLPFTDTLRLALHVDGDLNRFAATVDDDVASSRREMATVERGAPLADGFVAVPVLQVAASAGRGRFTAPDDLAEGELVAFRETWLRSLGLIPGRVHILFASGDSMVPTIRDGDMMLVDRSIDRVINDGIYVVVAVGAVRVKRVSMRQNGSVVLRSDNERYEAETIPADEVIQLTIEGRVRWVGGPI